MSFMHPANAGPVRCRDAALSRRFDFEPLPAAAALGLAVLVLEGRNGLLYRTAAMLRGQGVSLHLAPDALTAAGLLAAEARIGVLLADVSLLEGDGLGLAARLLSGDAEGPVVELVLVAEEDAAAEACEELLDTVHRALARAAARRAGLPVRLQGLPED